jgi:hypothetical protein
MGESDRIIAQTKLMGRIKCGRIRVIAGRQGWLEKEFPLPGDEVLAEALEQKKQQDDRTDRRSIPPISL